MKTLANIFKFGQSQTDRRVGQSTVELALLLPTVIFMLGMIIYAYRVNHKLSDKVTGAYAEKIDKYYNEKLLYDSEKEIFVPQGQYSEHIPPDALIDSGDIAKFAINWGAQLGLSELFSKLNINTETYAGAFAKGFTYSLAQSSLSHLIQGNLKDMGAKDLENATWAGATSALNSEQATKDFQGSNPTGSSNHELFGSGAQAGLTGFTQSHGDLKVAGASAIGGMLNSDTTKAWTTKGNDFSEIMKGAGIGAVQSSVSGAFGGKLEAKNILIGAATGAVQTEAFAKTLPLTGKDAKNSAMYGAFNGAFSSLISGGDFKTTLVSAGSGALSSKQTSTLLGGSKSLTYKATNMAGNAAGQLAQGSSLKAVGQGALISAASSAVGSAIGWAGNEISGSLRNSFSSTSTPHDAQQKLANPHTVSQMTDDSTFIHSHSENLEALSETIKANEVAKSLHKDDQETKVHEEKDHEEKIQVKGTKI